VDRVEPVEDTLRGLFRKQLCDGFAELRPVASDGLEERGVRRFQQMVRPCAGAREPLAHPAGGWAWCAGGSG
jgi:hypothetical protein